MSLLSKEELIKILEELRSYPGEKEWFEFKEAKTGLNFDDMGEIFSALSNEAFLKGKKWGWLVLGIEDKTKKIVGTQYKNSRASLDKLKHDITQNTNNVSFTEIYELFLPERVVMLQIPPALPGKPTTWKGHTWGRHGEARGALTFHELDRIRFYEKKDWSAEICPDATLDDLDEGAINEAKKQFLLKNKTRPFAPEIEKWDMAAFLDKAKITINGEITNTAVILLGKPESTHFLSPSVARITWKLENGEDAYEHFGPPFFLTINEIYKKIRNIKFKIMPDTHLIPIEVDKYDSWIILEALNNCIAHQDYSGHSRIIVIEKSDRLIFLNTGSFYEGTVEDYVLNKKVPSKYRNEFLAQAMVNLNMIDTMGYGIHKMFKRQQERFFPLPEYDFSNPEEVLLNIYGCVMDENYSKLLIEKTDLDLKTTILLDKVQKKKKLNREERKFLRDKKLIEGRHPNIFISAKIASITDEKAKYIKYRGFSKDRYKNLVINYIKKFGSATREEINDLLINELPAILDDKQKLTKIKNLIFEMSKKDKIIKNTGSKKKAIWILI